MNKREFLKSAAVIAGASAVKPLYPTVTGSGTKPVTTDKNGPIQPKKVVLKKGVGFGMIKEELSLVDKFKLIRDLGFDGVELNTPAVFPYRRLSKRKKNRELNFLP